MVYYWRGHMKLARGTLIHKFFTDAHEHYRAEVIRFVGFELRRGSVSDNNVVLRLKALCEQRIDGA